MGLKSALKQFKGKRVIVIGDILLDRFRFGEIERVNPEQPASPLVRITNETYVLGGAANVAKNVSALEAECLLYGVVGEDHEGERVIKMCGQEKISPKIFRSLQPTIVKERIIAHGQQVARVDVGEIEKVRLSEPYKREFFSNLEYELDQQGVDVLIFSDYNKGLLERDLIKKVINLTKRRQIPVLVDPKPANALLFEGCSLVRMNEREASEVSGISYRHDGDRLAEMSESILKKIGSRYCIITCGKEGVFCYDGKKRILIPTQARAVADVTGAGDTFIATLALGMVSGLNVFQASELANYASGNVVEKVGTATTSIPEIYQRLE